MICTFYSDRRLICRNGTKIRPNSLSNGRSRMQKGQSAEQSARCFLRRWLMQPLAGNADADIIRLHHQLIHSNISGSMTPRMSFGPNPCPPREIYSEMYSWSREGNGCHFLRKGRLPRAKETEKEGLELAAFCRLTAFAEGIPRQCLFPSLYRPVIYRPYANFPPRPRYQVHVFFEDRPCIKNEASPLTRKTAFGCEARIFRIAWALFPKETTIIGRVKDQVWPQIKTEKFAWEDFSFCSTWDYSLQYSLMLLNHLIIQKKNPDQDTVGQKYSFYFHI